MGGVELREDQLASQTAPRIEATRREKAAAETVLSSAAPAPQPLTFDEVLETLTALRDLPHLLETIDQADRAALYQALGLTLRYRRDNGIEQVKLTMTFSSLDLARIGLEPCVEGVDLKRVGGGTCRVTPRDRVSSSVPSCRCLDSPTDTGARSGAKGKQRCARLAAIEWPTARHPTNFLASTQRPTVAEARCAR